MEENQRPLTHINTETNQPGMVDVSDKQVSRRTAHARSIVVLGAAITRQLSGTELQTKKGPVFQTAIIAGTMAAKKTSDLIPLCHPLSLESCKVEISLNDHHEAVIDCTATIIAKTGVEMEALTGATVAALTIYDMCKALSHDIIIRETKLIQKTGGKNDFSRTA